jgi:hypothetical protein
MGFILFAGFCVFTIFTFMLCVHLFRWIFRVNDIHSELVKIRCALESMDNYIVGVKGRKPKEVKEEIIPKGPKEDLRPTEDVDVTGFRKRLHWFDKK